jgi:hypothetical protein
MSVTWDGVVVVLVVVIAAGFGVLRAARALGLTPGGTAAGCPSCGDASACSGKSPPAAGTRLVQLRRRAGGVDR